MCPCCDARWASANERANPAHVHVDVGCFHVSMFPKMFASAAAAEQNLGLTHGTSQLHKEEEHQLPVLALTV